MKYSDLIHEQRETVLIIDNDETLYNQMKRSLFSLSTTIKEKNVGIMLDSFNLSDNDKQALIDYYTNIDLEDY